MTDTILDRTEPPASGAAGAAGVVAKEATQARGRAVRRFTADLSAVGEPALWAFGGALAVGIILIAGFLFDDPLERHHDLLAQADRGRDAARRHGHRRRTVPRRHATAPATTCSPAHAGAARLRRGEQRLLRPDALPHGEFRHLWRRFPLGVRFRGG
jgi:hypothetical protein